MNKPKPPTCYDLKKLIYFGKPGFSFPLGLQLAQKRIGRDMVSLAWGINGFTSVVGSVRAIAIALLWRFNAALVIGGFIYGIAAIVSFFLSN
jgi:hypothetical protein